MKYTRRDFVKLSGIAAVAGFVTTGSARAQFVETDVLASRSADSFREYVGSEFYVWNEAVSTPVVLTKVQNFEAQAKGGECYALVFTTGLKKTEQDTYRVYHKDLGNFELMMTAGKNGKRATLVATINRI